MKRITEYMVLNDQNSLEVDVPKLLRKMGYPDTPETRQQVMDVCVEVFRELRPELPIDINTLDYGTKSVYNPTRTTG